MNIWKKLGVIFSVDCNSDWMHSHASIPVADIIENNVTRIYFGTRDRDNISRIGYIDVKSDFPSEIIGISEKSLIPLGRLGTFDDNGIMPSWIVNNNGLRYLYYIGWNLQKK